MSSPLVIVENLHRRFGKVEAVRGLSFELARGAVTGFIGANGAGKTTTMRMMAGLELPNAGKITIGGYDVVNFPQEVQARLGWMPDAYGTYDNMTVAEYLDFFARAYRLVGAQREKRVQEIMAFTDLGPISDRLMNTLSKGMAQRLCLGRALINDPEFLILDEPAAGLDPKARIEFKNVVRILASQNKTLFISSHILSELEEMCDSLLFIDGGRLVHHGEAATLKQSTAAELVVNIHVDGDPAGLRLWIAEHPGVTIVDEHRTGARVRFADSTPTALSQQLKQMLNEGVNVVDFHREEQKLEDAFVRILKSAQAANNPGKAAP